MAENVCPVPYANARDAFGKIAPLPVSELAELIAAMRLPPFSVYGSKARSTKEPLPDGLISEPLAELPLGAKL